MSDKAGSQAQPASVYSGYSQNRSYNNTGYQQVNGQGKYTAGYGASQLADAVAGMGVSAQQQLGNLHNFKQNMAGNTQGGLDLSVAPRSGYGNNPLMVLPNGQTIPVSAFYGQQQNCATDQSGQIQYVPTSMFPNFLGNNLLPGALSNYGWQYGVGNIPDLDPTRRGSWSSNDENGPLTPVVGAAGHTEFYSTYPYVGHQQTQQYIAGPIQPMKCADNKSYEMVNLDELTQRDPSIPRAVPALWTNQDEMSLAKCLQNPEGITNIYVRGFMPDTTDEDLERWASRFGEIESCKAIIDQDTGKCKG